MPQAAVQLTLYDYSSRFSYVSEHSSAKLTASCSVAKPTVLYSVVDPIASCSVKKPTVSCSMMKSMASCSVAKPTISCYVSEPTAFLQCNIDNNFS